MFLIEVLQMRKHGQLSPIARRGWRKQGHDPIFVESYWLFTLAMLLVLAAIFGVAHKMYGLMQVPSPLNKIMIALSAAAIFLVFIGFASFTDPVESFVDTYRKACNLMRATLEEIAGWSYDKINSVARETLFDLGEDLYWVEQDHGLYRAQTMAAKQRFENAYATFRKLGFIENESYGTFVPHGFPRRTVAIPVERIDIDSTLVEVWPTLEDRVAPHKIISVRRFFDAWEQETGFRMEMVSAEDQKSDRCRSVHPSSIQLRYSLPEMSGRSFELKVVGRIEIIK